jgi:predicted phage tail protein
MTPREQLIAYLSTLGALVIVFTVAVLAGIVSDAVIGKMETFGLGTITGGLIGVLRIPTSRSSVAATDGGDVNLTTKDQ